MYASIRTVNPHPHRKHLHQAEWNPHAVPLPVISILHFQTGVSQYIFSPFSKKIVHINWCLLDIMKRSVRVKETRKPNVSCSYFQISLSKLLDCGTTLVVLLKLEFNPYTSSCKSVLRASDYSKNYCHSKKETSTKHFWFGNEHSM